MPETIQVHLPSEINALLSDIKADRAKRFEPISNKSIVMDAIKAMHEALCHVPETQSQGM